MLRVDTETLLRKQLALLGTDHARLELRQPRSAGATRALLREIGSQLLAKELDVVDRCFVPSLVVNAVDEICLGILTSLSEHYLEAERAPAAPSVAQLARVEEYIAENYQRPLTLEALVEVSGVSARTCVVRDFLPRHGYTLHDYLARIRLTMAQANLPAYRDEATVSQALRCGFSSVHQFMQAYRNRFGVFLRRFRSANVRRAGTDGPCGWWRVWERATHLCRANSQNGWSVAIPINARLITMMGFREGLAMT